MLNQSQTHLRDELAKGQNLGNLKSDISLLKV